MGRDGFSNEKCSTDEVRSLSILASAGQAGTRPWHGWLQHNAISGRHGNEQAPGAFLVGISWPPPRPVRNGPSGGVFLIQRIQTKQ